MRLVRPMLVIALLSLSTVLFAQSLQLVDDRGNAVSGRQSASVGEHIVLRMVPDPADATVTNPQWTISGLHLKDWVVKDGEPRPMTVDDYLSPAVHFIWQQPASAAAPYRVRASALVNGTFVTAEATFAVGRLQKPEKLYSDDLLMESHNNWHSVYMFSSANTRRGDLFLTWHRSQIDYFDAWRDFFGYPSVADWDPTTPWVNGTPTAAQQHPSDPAPRRSYETRHTDLITIDLTGSGLDTESEGEYDFITQRENRGRRPEFIADNYVMKLETLRTFLCFPEQGCDPAAPPPGLARNGVAVLPSFWRIPAGADADPWFAAGCPTRGFRTCAASRKFRLADYTLREIGESLESGFYAADYRVNYHAFAHILGSEDMSTPISSMRDPIFWAWHKHLDSILTAWQNARREAGDTEALAALTIAGTPRFADDFSTLTVTLSHDVIPEFVLGANVLVNGSPARTVRNTAADGSARTFEFSGFDVPPDGPVEVVVRREINNSVRLAEDDPRPRSTLIVSRFGNPLTPFVSRFDYAKP